MNKQFHSSRTSLQNEKKKKKKKKCEKKVFSSFFFVLAPIDMSSKKRIRFRVLKDLLDVFVSRCSGCLPGHHGFFTIFPLIFEKKTIWLNPLSESEKKSVWVEGQIGEVRLLQSFPERFIRLIQMSGVIDLERIAEFCDRTGESIHPRWMTLLQKYEKGWTVPRALNLLCLGFLRVDPPPHRLQFPLFLD